MKKLLCLFLAFGALAGCSSSNDNQRQLELMASNRAGVLSAGLPLEYGPLQIMRVSSNKERGRNDDDLQRRCFRCETIKPSTEYQYLYILQYAVGKRAN